MKKLYSSLAMALLFVVAHTTQSANAAQHITGEGFIYDLNEGQAKLVSLLPRSAATEMTEIELPDIITANGAEYALTEIGKQCFNGNAILQSITFGNNITTVGANAFYQCGELSSVTFNKKLHTIDNMAFYGCTALGNVELNEGLDSIGHYAFWQNNQRTKATIPASVRGIGGNPFGMCQRLDNVAVSEGNEHYVAIDGVLFNKDTTVLICYPCAKFNPATGFIYTVPQTVKTIQANSIRGNLMMTECVMPEGLETIGAQAFLACGNMKKIRIPASVSTIGTDAFLQLDKLNDFSVAEGNKHYRSENGLLLTADGGTLIFCAIPSAEMIVPEGVATISKSAFSQKKGLTKVVLPSTLKTIGEQAFVQCPDLATVEFGTGVDEIKANAFFGCNSLTSAIIPSVTKIGDQAFANCMKITTVEFGDKLRMIGRAAFNTCIGITSLNLPGSIIVLGEGAFSSCQKVTEVILGEGLTAISKGCLSTCISLEKVTIPSSVKRIEDNAFNTNVVLKDLVFSEGLESIGAGAFNSCAALEEVTLPNSLVTLGELSFGNNTSMEVFTTGSGLKTIGTSALAGNSSMTDLTLNEGLESIGETAFAYTSVRTITIPSTVTTIGQHALSNNPLLESITDMAETPQVLDYDLFDEESADCYSTVELIVPAKSVEAYSIAAIWNKFTNIRAEQSALTNIDSEAPKVVDIYNLKGIRLDKPEHGINIMRMSDGTTRKIMVK